MRILNIMMLFIGLSYNANADEKLELHARQLALQIRCPVCQGQSIEDSNAPLAIALKTFILAQLNAGQNEAQIFNELKRQYGTRILLNPPFQPATYLLWLTPFSLAVLIVFFLMRFFK
ncbi:MAG: cytochrome c-type biogenesis protein CcmH [Alphaproteobacteria bacterium]|nr:cytochrome c-type biogenesis protein CcmH [Alphaproteobacteria bacterium]